MICFFATKIEAAGVLFQCQEALAGYPHALCSRRRTRSPRS
jgi:hypothetical protein